MKLLTLTIGAAVGLMLALGLWRAACGLANVFLMAWTELHDSE